MIVDRLERCILGAQGGGRVSLNDGFFVHVALAGAAEGIWVVVHWAERPMAEGVR